MEDWQSWAAATIVFFTILVLVFRSLRGRKRGCESCGPKGCHTEDSDRDA